jgi:triosephosphate isomerase
MRHPFIAGNWKMFKTVHEAVVYVKEFRSLVKDIEDVEIRRRAHVHCRHACAEAARNTRVGIAAQNLHWNARGAFTGEISGPMIKEAGAEHCDHRPLGAADAVRRNRRNGEPEGPRGDCRPLIPIACIGETLAEREAGATLSVLDRQIKAGFDGITGEQVGALVIAYEPVWAIGTGRTATAGQGRAHAHIRQRLRQWFGGAAPTSAT